MSLISSNEILRTCPTPTRLFTAFLYTSKLGVWPFVLHTAASELALGQQFHQVGRHEVQVETDDLGDINIFGRRRDISLAVGEFVLGRQNKWLRVQLQE